MADQQGFIPDSSSQQSSGFIPDGSGPPAAPKSTAPPPSTESSGNSVLGDVWDFLNKPMVKLPPGAEKEHPFINPLVEGLFTPLNTAAELTGGLANATTEIAPTVSKVLTGVMKTGAGLQMLQGASNILNSDDPVGYALGAVNLGLGALGFKFAPTEHPVDIKNVDVNKPAPYFLNSEANKPLFTGREGLLPPYIGRDINIPGNEEYQPSPVNPDIELPDTLGRNTTPLSGINPDIELSPYVGRNEVNDEFSKMLDKMSPEMRKAIQPAVDSARNFIPDSSIEEPQLARTEGGVKIGADVSSLGRILGSSLYSGDIGKIATKELLQNALDATKNNDNADIHVTFENNIIKPKAITVSDNGPGMTRQELETVFTDLGASGKRNDENASGGFGLAKAAPLLGGEKARVVSIVREADGKTYTHEFEGTPQELLEGVGIHTEETPGLRTGTSVTTFLPKETSLYDARTLVKNIASNSDYGGRITLNENEGIFKREPDIYFSRLRNDSNPHKITLSNEGSDVDIIIPSDAKYGNRVPRYSVLNNGMHQFNSQFGWDEVPGIPDKMMVNIRAKVPEGDRAYPFTANREQLRGAVQEQISKYVKENIINPAEGKRAEQLRQLYHGMPEQELPTGDKFAYYDVGKKFSPEDMDAIQKSYPMNNLAQSISNIVNHTLELARGSGESWADRVKKIGYIFHQDKNSITKGIHIPSPGENASAILINPFGIFNTAGQDVDNASSSMLHTILHEVAHAAGGGHDEGFAQRLARIYEQLGSRAGFNAERSITNSISGDGRTYLPEVQELLQRYNATRRDAETPEDPLFGTGTFSRNKQSRGESEIPKYAQSGEVGTADSVNRFFQAVRDALPQRKEQEDLYSQERAKRAGEASKAFTKVGGGLRGHFASLGKLSGKMPKVDYEPIHINEQDANNLINVIGSNPNLQFYEKARAITGLTKILGYKKGDPVPQRNELALLGKVFGEDRMSDVHQLFGGLGAIPNKWSKVVEAANIPKAAITALHLSMPFRQGIGLIGTKPFWEAFTQIKRNFGSEEAYRGLNEANNDTILRTAKKLGIPGNNPIELARDMGLAITQLNGPLTDREEQLLGRTALHAIPGIKASNRAYQGFLTKLRVDNFESLIDDAKAADAGSSVLGLMNKLGIPDKTAGMSMDPARNKVLADALADFVNNASGRGDLGKYGNRIAPVLNTVFFSPRMIAARVNSLNPYNFVNPNIPNFVKLQYMKSLFGIAAAELTVAALAKMGGGRIGTDKNSSDFGKIIFGNVRIDPSGGYQQYLVAAQKLTSGLSRSSSSGRMTNLSNPKFGQENRLDVLQNLAADKLAPVPRFIYDWMHANGPDGKKFQATPEVMNMFVPIIANNIFQLAQSDPNLLPLAIPAALGIGVEAYNTPNAGQAMAKAIR